MQQYGSRPYEKLTTPSLEIFKQNYHPRAHQGGLDWTSWLVRFPFYWQHYVYVPLEATWQVTKDDFSRTMMAILG